MITPDVHANVGPVHPDLSQPEKGHSYIEGKLGPCMG